MNGGKAYFSDFASSRVWSVDVRDTMGEPVGVTEGWSLDLRSNHAICLANKVEDGSQNHPPSDTRISPFILSIPISSLRSERITRSMNLPRS